MESILEEEAPEALTKGTEQTDSETFSPHQRTKPFEARWEAFLGLEAHKTLVLIHLSTVSPAKPPLGRTSAHSHANPMSIGGPSVVHLPMVPKRRRRRFATKTTLCE